MTDWQQLTDAEIVDLATRLRTIDWSWRMEDVTKLADQFGWRVLRARPDWVMLDNGFGMASGRVGGRRGHAEDIDLRVTGFATDDSDGRAQVRDAFTRMVAALTSSLGEPTLRKPGKAPEVRWAGTTTTLRLVQLSASVKLHLVTNAALASHDETVELEEQGLL
ncbi:DUF6301 family protein [Nocardia transvalensis]|uniref:DUF6301 family protein n=1 Tax=Nocardia transvalensis TaxID=37333 RepID=UPI001894FCC0|nr:DUF6301 family protein [Nocardia transvalensis]MBF6332781.1 hypothetical protein [Nocardia transvalensis]